MSMVATRDTSPTGEDEDAKADASRVKADKRAREEADRRRREDAEKRDLRAAQPQLEKTPEAPAALEEADKGRIMRLRVKVLGCRACTLDSWGSSPRTAALLWCNSSPGKTAGIVGYFSIPRR